MKSIQLIVFLLFSSFFAIAWASSDTPFNSSVPVQSFQTAESPATTVPAQAHSTVKKRSKVKTAPSDAAQMAKVESIMTQSKESLVSKPAAKPLNAIPAETGSAPLQPKTHTAAVKELASQISELNQSELLYQQNTNQRIDRLSAQNEALQAKLTKLTEAMLMINQELSQVMPRGTSAASQMALPTSQHVVSTLNNSQVTSLGTWSQRIQARFHGPTIYLAFVVVILLALLMAMLLRQNNTKSLVNKSSHEDDTREEYDFMGSSEAIPTKLDLARTYIDMDDTLAARKVLDDVVQKGNKEQKKIASELLKKIQ